MSLMWNVAYADGGQAVAGPGGLVQFIPMIAIFGVFYFFLIRPQQKKENERLKMIENLKKGDRIATQGGIIGAIHKIKDDVATVEVAENVRIKIFKSSIATLIQDIPAAPANDDSPKKLESGS